MTRITPTFRVLAPDEPLPPKPRRGPRPGPLHPEAQALVDGHRIFIPGVEHRRASDRFRILRQRRPGLIVRTRKGEEGGVAGVYVWTEPRP